MKPVGSVGKVTSKERISDRINVGDFCVRRTTEELKEVLTCKVIR